MNMQSALRNRTLSCFGLLLLSMLSTGCSSPVSTPEKDEGIRVYGKKIDRAEIQGEPVMSIEAPNGITVGELLEIRSAIPTFSSDVSCAQAISRLREEGLDIQQRSDNTLVAVEPVQKLTVTYRFPNSLCPASAVKP